MATKINVRSPFYIKVGDANLSYATLQLYIYTGVKDITPDAADLKYTITKSELSFNNFVVFEISELVRDYLEIEFDGVYDSQCVWVNPVITAYNVADTPISSPTITPDNSDQFIAFDGYGYFEEGLNPELSRGLLMSNRTIFRINDSNVRIPVFAESTNSVAFYYQGTLKRTLIPSVPTENTDEQIDYITVSGSDDTDTYQERVLADGGTLEVSVCLSDFLETIDVGLVDEVWVNYDTGTTFTGSGGVTSTEDTKTDIIKIKTTDCSRYTPIKVTFVNKYGALQDLWFRLKSTETTDVRGESYKRSILNQGATRFDDVSYKRYQHQKQSFQVNANDRITMNTGYLNDDHNAVMEELMLSEQVWMTKLTDEELVLPIVPRTKSITYKTSLNDRLANYTVEFDMAFDKINNIR
jgi:hypothetical protein